MRIKTCMLAFAVTALLTLAGCDSTGPVQFERQVAVEAYLTAGESFGPIRLTYTAPLNSTYDAGSLGVSGAKVEVQELDASGQVVARYPFTENANAPGIYLYLENQAGLIKPQTTYRLEAMIPGEGAPLTAQTTVPADIQVRSVSADSLVYQGPEQLEVQIARQPQGRPQRVFVFTTEAEDVSADNLTPFARALYDNGDVDLHDLDTGSSPLINEANYPVADDSTLTVQLPWIAISFYGFNGIYITSVDQNYYDFRRTSDVQQGGSTLAPGEIPEVLDHVEGGTGIFASLARTPVFLYVKRPSESP